MKLGRIRIDNPFVQAPMAGVTDHPFRTVARRFHKGLLFTEMISAEALCRSNSRTLKYASIEERHHPVALQLVGHDPERMAQAAKMAQTLGADIVDINAGCPDTHIVSQGAGGALLRNPEKLAALVSRVVKSVTLPVSVKLRLGYDRDNSVKLGKLLEPAGAEFLTFNGYLVTDKFQGTGDREALKKIVDLLDIPVIVNGGVKDEEDAVRMLQYTGAQGVMMGRATRGRPDLPGRSYQFLKDGGYDVMGPEEFWNVVMHHARLECEMFGEGPGIRRMRKHFIWYFRAYCLKYESAKVCSMETLEDVETLLSSSLYSNVSYPSGWEG